MVYLDQFLIASASCSIACDAYYKLADEGYTSIYASMANRRPLYPLENSPGNMQVCSSMGSTSLLDS